MFGPPPAAGQGVLLVESADSRWGTAIHMAFVMFPLGVAWLDGARRVVDCRVARPWHVYVPAGPARFVLEGAVEMMDRVAVGELLEFVDADAA